MSTLSLRQIGLLLIPVGLFACSDVLSGEPSERDIGQALGLGKEISPASHLHVFASLAKQGGPLGGFVFATKLKVTNVRKTECAKATGKPGFVCAFSATISNSKEPERAGQVNLEGRFVKSADGWTLASDL